MNFLDTDMSPNYGALLCAHCNHEYTHVEKLYWFRRGEDESQCNTGFLALSGFGGNMKTSNKYNPSARRDGMCIFYRCESCEALSSLNVVQHKGITEVSTNPCAVGDTDYIHFGDEHD